MNNYYKYFYKNVMKAGRKILKLKYADSLTKVKQNFSSQRIISSQNSPVIF